MEQEIIELRKLTAAEGMMLYNGESFGKEVYLGRQDSPENWREITEAEYEALLQAQLAAGQDPEV
ncbi:MAG: hypothetical protein J6B67_00290 [Oscillospiraceae bacterium]|nr:hypothetical protein [Oscillospiraceae bacterium]